MNTILRYRLEIVVLFSCGQVLFNGILDHIIWMEERSEAMPVILLGFFYFFLGKDHADIVGMLKTTPASKREITKYEYIYQIITAIIVFSIMTAVGAISYGGNASLKMTELIFGMSFFMCFAAGIMSIYNPISNYYHLRGPMEWATAVGVTVITTTFLVICENSLGRFGLETFCVTSIIIYAVSYFISINMNSRIKENSEEIKT